MAFCGAVLCGGASRRMGRDKALLPVDGVAMAVRVAEVLALAGAADVVAIGGDADGLTKLGLRVVPDDEPGDGPFPATLTALRVATAPVVMVVSCDLLAPDAASMRATVAALEASPESVVGAVPLVEGHHQWTHAAWRVSGLPALEAARSAGVGSLKRAAAHLSLVEVGELAPGGLRDADTAADLPRASRPTRGVDR